MPRAISVRSRAGYRAAVPSATPVIIPGRRLSYGLVVLAALAVPALPILHLCNKLSTQRTLAAVGKLAQLPHPRLGCQPARVGQAVNGAARLLRMQTSTCLARSQLIWLLVSWCGQRPIIRLGAAAGLGAGTSAHAWVELDGVPVADATNVAELHPPFDRPLLGSVS